MPRPDRQSPRPGLARRVSQRDVANQCGLSVMTVSMALRGDCDSLRPETVARVRTAARELGYDISHAAAARRLRYAGSEQTVVNHLVGLHVALHLAQGVYFKKLLEGLNQALSRQRFAILTNWADDDVGAEGLPMVFQRGEVDGVFLLSGARDSDRVMRLLRAEPGFGDRPIVSILDARDDCHCLLVDDFAGGLALGRHLVQLGHREVFYPDFGGWQMSERLRGLRQALTEVGESPEQALHPVPRSPEPQVGWRYLSGAVAAHPRCHALFAGNDDQAWQAANWARQQGLRVPQDLSLVGFDDTHHLPDEDGTNLLTTVRLPLAEVGREAGELLLRLVHAPPPTERVVRTWPVELVVRGSTAPAPVLAEALP